MMQYDVSYELSRKLTIIDEVYTYGFDAVVMHHTRWTNPELDFIHTLKCLSEDELRDKYEEVKHEAKKNREREWDDDMLIQYYKHKALYEALKEVEGETILYIMWEVLNHEYINKEEIDNLDIDNVWKKMLNTIKNKVKLYSKYQNTLPDEIC